MAAAEFSAGHRIDGVTDHGVTVGGRRLVSVKAVPPDAGGAPRARIVEPLAGGGTAPG